MQKPLTHRQKQVLDFITDHISRHGFPPSIRELRAELEISSLRGVTIHLDALQRKGWIERSKTSRSIRVLSDVTDTFRPAQIPLLGTIAAGHPILAVENVETYINIPESLTHLGTQNLIALRVQGDSMTGDGILPGDIIIIRLQEMLSEGEIGAFLIEDEAAVKRAHFESERMVLMSSNSIYEPIITDSRFTRIIGKVVGLTRVY